MEFFDELEVIGGIIPNLIGLAVFSGAIIYFDQTRKAKVIAIYEKARQLTKKSGIKHNVNHIKPVSKGGSNHPDNLQILTAEENLKKGAY